MEGIPPPSSGASTQTYLDSLLRKYKQPKAKRTTVCSYFTFGLLSIGEVILIEN
jgi:hypothetical protein